jgi:Tetratricopeptide repeat
MMETSKTKLGADHPDTLTSMANLAVTWKDMGRRGEALGLIQTCSELQQRILGVGHPHTLSTLSTLNAWRDGSEQLPM